MGTLKSLYRYPIKGLSAQALGGAVLITNQPLPFDRLHALTRPGSKVDPQKLQWAHKSNFVMLMQDEVLATLDTTYDVISGRLQVQQKEALVLDVYLSDLKVDRSLRP
jgi:GntR family transcriptional regulator/MocR family aminotransferase